MYYFNNFSIIITFFHFSKLQYYTISYSTTNSLTLFSFTLLVYTMLRNVLTLLTILTLSVKAQDPHAGHDHGSADGDNGWEWIGAFDLRK